MVEEATVSKKVQCDGKLFFRVQITEFIMKNLLPFSIAGPQTPLPSKLWRRIWEKRIVTFKEKAKELNVNDIDERILTTKNM